mmetsp:Transcript_6179/g.15871  ORF Transcript_6179/g.15871 Transcript_6179/m.15871 type:complete len:206 (+) Transcript_6179:836-1453(+)
MWGTVASNESWSKGGELSGARRPAPPPPMPRLASLHLLRAEVKEAQTWGRCGWPRPQAMVCSRTRPSPTRSLLRQATWKTRGARLQGLAFQALRQTGTAAERGRIKRIDPRPRASLGLKASRRSAILPAQRPRELQRKGGSTRVRSGQWATALPPAPSIWVTAGLAPPPAPPSQGAPLSPNRSRSTSTPRCWRGTRSFSTRTIPP